MSNFFIDLVLYFCIIFVIIYTPAVIYKAKTRNAIFHGYTKYGAIFSGILALIICFNKYLT